VEKARLKKEIQKSRNKQKAAFKVYKKALVEMRVARVKEEQLQ
jgi:hypothetical protein